MAKFDPKMVRDHSDLGARFKEIEGRIRSLETASGLDSASFAGRLRVATGGQFQIDGGGDITMNGGGMLTGNDGAGIRMMHPGNNTECVQAGTFTNGSGTSYGLTALTPQGEYLFGAANSSTGGATWVTIGDPQDPADDAWIYADRTLVQSTGGYIQLDSNPDGGGGLYFTGLPIEGTANLAIAPDGRVSQVSSSARYKQDVTESPVTGDEVLALSPKHWRFIDDVANRADEARVYNGFIAEDVDASGFTDAVVYDAEGRPDAVDPTAISSSLVALCQRQQTEIDTLKTTVAALAARLDALEA